MGVKRVFIVRVDRKRVDGKVLEPVAEIVRRGGLVVYPTDTVYGLGADPFNERAVERIYEVKKRDRSKPLPVLVASLRDAERIAVLTSSARKLAGKYWPGPLTLILKARSLPCILTACTGKVAVRMPGDPVALLLVELSGGLLIGTSANISGRPPPRTAREALEQIGREVDAVVDAGPSFYGLPSTVVDVSTGRPRLVRRGPIRLEDIERSLERS